MWFTRRKAAILLGVLLAATAAWAVNFALGNPASMLAHTLVNTGKILAVIGSCFVGAAVVYLLVSTLLYACGVKYTLIEVVFLGEHKETPATANWAKVADSSVKIITNRVKRLKVGDTKGLEAVVKMGKDKLAQMSEYVNNSEQIILEGENFLESYDQHMADLNKMEQDLAKEISELSEGALDRSMRTMKASMLIEVQNKKKLLEGKKRHYENITGTINSTTLLVASAKSSIERILQELNLKKQREEVLGK